jgi:glycosyltransferase involved in cell wall biosynthesis
MQHILLLEPYYGGSHKAFLTGLIKLQDQLDCRFTLLSLPARKWKMRMQLAAPYFAEQILKRSEQGATFDSILTSTFLDVAVLRSLLARQGIHLRLALYFHENQFSYPGQVHDPGMFQFTSINFTSALCADRLAFNSHYNRDTFLAGVRQYVKKAVDMDLSHLEEQIWKKSVILSPGIDFQQIDDLSLLKKIAAVQRAGEQVIVWNHRWEHDKDPETFFHTLFALAEKHPFQLIVLGQHFKNQPAIFAQAKTVLHNRIRHFGYVKSRQDYAHLLMMGDYIVSTARHEFFGIAVLEGVRAGCRPVVPDRLSYKELFPQKYRYAQGTLQEHLQRLLACPDPVQDTEAHRLTDPYSWPRLEKSYREWLQVGCTD